LIRTLIDEHNFQDAKIAPPLPSPYRKQQALAKLVPIDEIFLRLHHLDGWHFVDTRFPPRQELRKMYEFASFERAIEFMSHASRIIDKNQHHPRWENQFRTLTVYFSTWAVGSRVTEIDFAAARRMDALFDLFEARNDARPLTAPRCDPPPEKHWPTVSRSVTLRRRWA
jgi:4a-hydroxytetrahydrobiopterin dehydratase